jgi:hypothetical protein
MKVFSETNTGTEFIGIDFMEKHVIPWPRNVTSNKLHAAAASVLQKKQQE